jgi:hypothetical protein
MALAQPGWPLVPQAVMVGGPKLNDASDDLFARAAAIYADKPDGSKSTAKLQAVNDCALLCHLA